MAIEFWHTMHSCEHAVWWSDAGMAVLAATRPCPWCGEETGQRVPAEQMTARDAATGILVFRHVMPDGSIPWPDDMTGPGAVVLRHRADNTCCGLD